MTRAERDRLIQFVKDQLDEAERCLREGAGAGEDDALRKVREAIKALWPWQ